jgi:hypothetical protein
VVDGSDPSPAARNRGCRRGLRRAAWIAGALMSVLAVVLAGAALAYPTAAATLCPRCYGLVPLQEDLYVERGLSEAQRTTVIAAVADGTRLVEQFYGSRISSPDILVCLSADCYDRIGGGGERGRAVLDRAVLLSPRGVDAVIVAHELSHIEFHRRLGPAREGVPQWFDEGLAVLVSDDPRHLLPDNATDRCRLAPRETLPETLAQWQNAAREGERLYSMAACQVSRWVDSRGGALAVLDLIDRLNDGETFATSFEE